MLNLNELENKWLRYKIKSYIPHAIIVFFIIVASITVSSLNSKKEETKKTVQKEIVEEIKKEETKKEIIVKKDTIKSNEKLLITPSLNFMKTIQNDSTKKKEIKKEYVRSKIKEIIYTQETVKVKDIDIQRQNTKEDIQHVIKRFRKSNNPVLSLFIAKKYYELGEYSKAYNYALITNGINNNIEDSWMIFAKSLYKLDKKEKSIEVLNRYINHTHSNRAKVLLDNIKSGKLK